MWTELPWRNPLCQSKLLKVLQLAKRVYLMHRTNTSRFVVYKELGHKPRILTTVLMLSWLMNTNASNKISHIDHQLWTTRQEVLAISANWIVNMATVHPLDTQLLPVMHTLSIMRPVSNLIKLKLLSKAVLI